MKIYTKTGDKGSTSLIGGSRVLKNDVQIEAYGTVDELNANIGLLSDLCNKDGYSVTNVPLLKIQNELFVIGSHLAVGLGKSSDNLPKLKQGSIDYLESLIDKYNLDLSPMTHFILPGGHHLISQAHVARTVCRRAERRVVALKNEKIDLSSIDLIVIYLNRLSDFLFVLARKIAHDKNIDEIKWKS